MTRVSFGVRNLTVGTTPYKLFVHGSDGAAYFEYNPDNLYIAGGKVYVKVEGAGGEINTILFEPGTPWAEGNTLESFGHMIYHLSQWWLMIS